MSVQPSQSNGISAAMVARGLIKAVPDIPAVSRPVLRFALNHNDRRTAGALFQHTAHSYPARPFLRFRDETVTYDEANRRINRYARLLADVGIRGGDTVAILARNHPMTVLVMLAAVKLGAIAGLLNYNQRGQGLAHSLRAVNASAIIVDLTVDVLDTVESSERPAISFDFDELHALAEGFSDENLAITASLDSDSPALYVLTSGTTGLPKASVMRHRRWVLGGLGFGAGLLRLRSTDVLYCPLPLYHNNAMTAALASVVTVGACLAIGPSFSASRFWDEVISNDATAFVYIGEICRYLLAQPPKASDRAHTVRVIMGNGMRPDIWSDFAERFTIPRIGEFYTGSELPIAAMNFFGVTGSAGVMAPMIRAIVQYDPDAGEPIRDGSGRMRRVTKGQEGLLLLKNTKLTPFEGYTDQQATGKKLLSGCFAEGDSWVNTGDVVCEQGLWHIAFVDRLGDTFRWKGENVATSEVEAVLNAHPDILESSVYGVSMPGHDGKAGMAAVTLRSNEIDLVSLREYLDEKLPRYAVPVFLRVVQALDTTSTFKNQKVRLRNLGYEPTGEPLYMLGEDGDYIEFDCGTENVSNFR